MSHTPFSATSSAYQALLRKASQFQAILPILFCGILLSLACIGCDNTTKFKEAQDLRAQGKYQESMGALSEFLGKYPEHELAPEAREWLGRLPVWITIESLATDAEKAVQRGAYGMALDALTEAITKANQQQYPDVNKLRTRYEEVKPQLIQSLHTSAEAALKGGDPKLAIRKYEESYKLLSPSERQRVQTIVAEIQSLLRQIEIRAANLATQRQADAVRRNQANAKTETAAPQLFDWSELFGDEDETQIVDADSDPSLNDSKNKLKKLFMGK